MISTWVLAFLSGWLVTSAIAFVAARNLGEHRPALQTLALSIAAGVVWPLLVVGAIEVSTVAVWSAATSRRQPQDELVARSWVAPEAALSLR